MNQYDDEQSELENKIDTLKQSIEEDEINNTDIFKFISIIKKYKEPTEITDLMFNELIDKIVVYEAEGKGNKRTQRIDIYFNFVGQVNIDYTKEELAELREKAKQEEQEKINRQREYQRKVREKRRAKKISENGGSLRKKKICPHCGVEFIPTSNRQIFCSKECCYQERQEKAKHSENYSFKKRTCVVCGKEYQPTHSQQRYCCEDCRKIMHNQQSINSYYKNKQECAI